jgi:hypothetical protein
VLSPELVVAVAHEHVHGNCLDPPNEQHQHVEGGLVCPVCVFDHQDRRSGSLQLTRERSKDFVRPRPTFDERFELPTGRVRDVEQRPQWTWCEQSVARTPQDARRSERPFAEMSQERRLANARLAADEHEASFPLPLDVRQQLSEDRQLTVALEEIADCGVMWFHQPSASWKRGAAAVRSSRSKCSAVYAAKSNSSSESVS